ncbi:MAG: hypothetical protein QNL03_01595 [Gammaproteobacteria bacterium]|nr:hypothetical protein [Gammaproteobacteria bacterium]
MACRAGRPNRLPTLGRRSRNRSSLPLVSSRHLRARLVVTTARQQHQAGTQHH